MNEPLQFPSGIPRADVPIVGRAPVKCDTFQEGPENCGCEIWEMRPLTRVLGRMPKLELQPLPTFAFYCARCGAPFPGQKI
jgi:hypothetical protein